MSLSILTCFDSNDQLYRNNINFVRKGFPFIKYTFIKYKNICIILYFYAFKVNVRNEFQLFRH